MLHLPCILGQWSLPHYRFKGQIDRDECWGHVHLCHLVRDKWLSWFSVQLTSERLQASSKLATFSCNLAKQSGDSKVIINSIFQECFSTHQDNCTAFHTFCDTRCHASRWTNLHQYSVPSETLDNTPYTTLVSSNPWMHWHWGQHSIVTFPFTLQGTKLATHTIHFSRTLQHPVC